MPGDMTADSFVEAALAQQGKPYVFGAEVKLDDPSPAAFDCSELVQWAAHRVGVEFPDGVVNQLAACEKARTAISVEQALLVRGALLIRCIGPGHPAHVAISLGDGTCMEARGKDFGCGVFSAHGRLWTHGALVPGMRY